MTLMIIDHFFVENNDLDVQVAFPKGTFSPVTFPPGTRLLHGTTSPGDHGLQVKPGGFLDILHALVKTIVFVAGDQGDFLGEICFYFGLLLGSFVRELNAHFCNSDDTCMLPLYSTPKKPLTRLFFPDSTKTQHPTDLAASNPYFCHRLLFPSLEYRYLKYSYSRILAFVVYLS